MPTFPVYRALPGAGRALFGEKASVLWETTPVAPPKPCLLDRVRTALRARHNSRRTEDAYVAWIKRYIFLFLHTKRSLIE